MALETLVEEESDDSQTLKVSDIKIQPQNLIESSRVNEEEMKEGKPETQVQSLPDKVWTKFMQKGLKNTSPTLAKF